MKKRSIKHLLTGLIFYCTGTLLSAQPRPARGSIPTPERYQDTSYNVDNGTRTQIYRGAACISIPVVYQFNPQK